MQTILKPLCLSFSLLILLFVVPEQANGQISDGGRPLSYTLGIQPNVEIVDLPSLNVDSLSAVDEIERAEGKAFRFGIPIHVDLNLENSGTWDTLDGGALLWRLKIRAQGAKTININYDEFQLAEGARYFIYNPNDTSQYIGAFTHNTNSNGGIFATSFVRGSEMVLEYYEPAGTMIRGKLAISSIVHGYRGVGAATNSANKGFGDSYPCHINVSSPSADPWEDQIHSVVMISTDTNSRICSGVLVNNVRQDETPYILTAAHCLNSVDSLSRWIFYFNYESPIFDSVGGCDSTIDGTVEQNIVGATLKALITPGIDGDNMLLLLDSPVPSSYNAYFAGWRNDTTRPTSTVTIHHPGADVKKISFDDDPPGDFNFSFLSWDPTYHPDSGTGLVEGFSSGAPLFDQDKRVVGNHHNANPNTGDLCIEASQDSRFANFIEPWATLSDSSEQLKYWLDPDTTDTLFIDGFDPNASCCIGNRGDANGDGTDATILDLTYLVDYIFRGGPVVECTEEGNMNGDPNENVDILDLTFLVDYIWRGGPAPGACP